MHYDQDNIATPSKDQSAMLDYFEDVDALLGGVKTMRERSEIFLPQFPKESAEAYAYRKQTTKFTNIFWDIVENLAQRPFAKPVGLTDESPSQLVDFCDDVDGDGNNLHVFASGAFFDAVAYGVDAWLIDYTSNVPRNTSRAQERQLGVRPYWIRYQATSVLEASRKKIAGKWEYISVRLKECVADEDGAEVNQIRHIYRERLGADQYAPAVTQLWRMSEEDDNKGEWIKYGEPKPMTIGVIPFVYFLTGRRKGSSSQFHPPMRGAAELQVEHYQQESALKHAKTMTAFPMLSAAGVTPPSDAQGNPVQIQVGPHVVLYAPPNSTGNHGEWSWIEPSAESLRFLAEDVKDTARELRELGRQPLTAESGNLTVVTTAYAATKGNSAVQNWMLGAKDALELALYYTGLWLRVSERAKVMVDLEFDHSIDGEDDYEHVLSLREKGEISRKSAIHEAKRRNILDRDYDEDADLEELLNEIETGEDEEDPDDTGGGGGNPPADPTPPPAGS